MQWNHSPRNGRLLLLGRSVRHPPDWLIGLDVVDVASGRLVRSFEFGRRPSSASNQGASASAPSSPVATPRVVAGAYASPPQAAFSSDGRHVVLSLTESAEGHTTLWQTLVATISAGRLEEPKPLARADSGELTGPCTWGFADGETLIRLCGPATDRPRWVLERLRLNGGSDLIPLDLADGSWAYAHVLDARGRLWLWDPFGWWLTRVDLASGATQTRQLQRPTASAAGDELGGLLQGLWAWFAPSAEAKMLIQPAMAFSPEAKRLYLVASASPSPQDGAGSAGILVIDPDTLDVLDRWAPFADVGSIAVSADGRFVYAAGLPGVDASGAVARTWEASLAAYDACTGEVRLIVGRLGSSWLFFRATDDPWWSY